MLSVKMHGMKELQQQLLELRDVALAAKVLARAARKAFVPVLEAAKAGVPVDTGLLRDSLKLVVKKAPKDSSAAVVVGIRVAVGKGGDKKSIAKAASSAAAVAFARGARGDALKKASRGGRTKAWRNSAHWRWHFVELGTAKKGARPFLRPALSSNAPLVLELLKQELAAGIQRVLRKRARAAAA